MNLRVYLATKEMTITDFARIIECNPCYLSNIMSGRASPSRRLLKDIEYATGGVVKMARKEKNKPQELKEETHTILLVESDN